MTKNFENSSLTCSDDIFSQRIQEYMRYPIEKSQLKRETFAISLRKSKRASLITQKRIFLGGSISSKPPLPLDSIFLEFPTISAIFPLLSSSALHSSCALTLKSLESSLPLLFPFLTPSPHAPELFSTTLYFFSSLSLFQSCTPILLKHKAHLKLLEALEISLETECQIIIICLSNFCCDSKEVANDLMENSYLGLLWDVVVNNETTKAVVANGLLKVVENTGKDLDENQVSEICKIIGSVVGNMEARGYVMSVLNCLGKMGFEHEWIKPFVGLVVDELMMNRNLNASIGVIDSITTEYSDITMMFIENGLFNGLAEVFEKNDDWKEKVLFVISNIVAENKHISSFLMHKIRAIVIKAINHNRLNVKIECSYVVRNLVYSSDERQLCVIVTQELFNSISKVIECDNALAYNYLQVISQCFAFEFELGKITGYFENSGCLEKVQKMVQNRHGKVWKLAEDILQTYNGVDKICESS